MQSHINYRFCICSLTFSGYYACNQIDELKFIKLITSEKTHVLKNRRYKRPACLYNIVPSMHKSSVIKTKCEQKPNQTGRVCNFIFYNLSNSVKRNILASTSTYLKATFYYFLQSRGVYIRYGRMQNPVEIYILL